MLNLLLAFNGIRPSSSGSLGVLGLVRHLENDEYFLDWKQDGTITDDEIIYYRSSIIYTESKDYHQEIPISSLRNAISLTRLQSIVGDNISGTLLVATIDARPVLFTSTIIEPVEIVAALLQVLPEVEGQVSNSTVAYLSRKARPSNKPLSSIDDDWGLNVMEFFARVKNAYVDTAKMLLENKSHNQSVSEGGAAVLNPWIIPRKIELPEPSFTLNLVDLNTWKKFVQCDGTVMNYPNLARIIHCGSIDKNIRLDLWIRLLGLREPEMNDAKFDKQSIGLKMEYEILLGSKKCSEETIGRIEKDVWRTDRKIFCSNESEVIKHPTMSLMTRVLIAYNAYDQELDYVQGMNDYLSPIVYLYMRGDGQVPEENEFLVFWMFCKLMSIVRGNFEFCSQEMEQKLELLREMIWKVDPQYYDFFSLHHDSLQMYFCYRWFLLWFKREFKYEEVFMAILSAEDKSRYVLCVALAMLMTEREAIVSSCRRFDQILKHFNDKSGKWFVKEILQTASQFEKLFK